MSFTLAITGKGGVGKTTVSAMIVRQLIANGKKPVLAVDADPNSCLDAALGVKVTNSVGKAREEVRQEVTAGTVSGIAKQDLLELKISESLVESENFDMIAMGRPEGAGCYCYANNVLKNIIGKLSSQYPFVVLDNEAGLENLSRRIMQNVDALVIVSDPSNAGVETILRLHSLAAEMNISYKKLVVILNRIRGGRQPVRLAEIKEITKADIIVCLPDNEEIALFSEESRCFLELPENNPVLLEIDNMIKTII